MGTQLSKPALDVGLVSAEPERLLAFYTEVFGLVRQEPLRLPTIGTIHKLGAGESVLRILEPEKAPAESDTAAWSERHGIRYLTLEVADARAAASAVEAHGGSVVLEPFELRPGRIVSQVLDPDGNMLEVGQG